MARGKRAERSRRESEEFLARWRDLLRDVSRSDDARDLAKILLDETLRFGAFESAFNEVLHETKLVEQQKLNMKEAEATLYRDYYEDVESVGEDAKRAIRDGEITDAESLQEWLHSAIEGTQRVIYTHQAKMGFVVSENQDAYFEDFGAEGALNADGIRWETLMYVAMERDVVDWLGRNGVDVNDPVAEEDEDEGD